MQKFEMEVDFQKMWRIYSFLRDIQIIIERSLQIEVGSSNGVTHL